MIYFTDYFRTTGIFFVTESRPSNITFQQDDNVEIYFRLKNNSDNAMTKRQKRHVLEHTDRSISNFKNEDYKKAREIIMNHNVLCNSESKNEICKDIVNKLKTITEQENPGTETIKTKKGASTLTTSEHIDSQKLTKVGDMTLRETDFLPEELTGLASRHAYGLGGESYPSSWPSYSVPHPQPQPLPHLPDTCLLARLLKQNHPHHQGDFICRN